MVERQIAKHVQHFTDERRRLIMGGGRFLAPKPLEVK